MNLNKIGVHIARDLSSATGNAYGVGHPPASPMEVVVRPIRVFENNLKSRQYLGFTLIATTSSFVRDVRRWSMVVQFTVCQGWNIAFAHLLVVDAGSPRSPLTAWATGAPLSAWGADHSPPPAISRTVGRRVVRGGIRKLFARRARIT